MAVPVTNGGLINCCVRYRTINRWRPLLLLLLHIATTILTAFRLSLILIRVVLLLLLLTLRRSPSVSLWLRLAVIIVIILVRLIIVLIRIPLRRIVCSTSHDLEILKESYRVHGHVSIPSILSSDNTEIDRFHMIWLLLLVLKLILSHIVNLARFYNRRSKSSVLLLVPESIITTSIRRHVHVLAAATMWWWMLLFAHFFLEVPQKLHLNLVFEAI